MATQEQINNFIKEIAPYAQKAYRTLGKVRPSICIGMACVESAYGTSPTMRSHNAFFGQKVGSGKTATKYWDGTSYNSKTKEEYQVGVHTTISAAFRSYKDMEQCVFNFYELLNSGLYSRVKADVHYTTQMEQIKTCGYMTSSTEVNSVLTVIARNDLTRYDDEVGLVCAVNTRTLKRRCSGMDVRNLQMALNKHGYNLKVDGKFGKNTEAAVRDFQDAHGLVVDGIVGQKTWKALLD